MLIDDVVGDITRCFAFGRIIEAEHLTRLGVELRMCGKRQAGNAAIRTPYPWFPGDGSTVRQPIFFEASMRPAWKQIAVLAVVRLLP
jgi:hypothetical protein